MTEKTNVQVIIDNKVLTISGYESEEYLQRVAMHINSKISELNKMDGFKFATKDIQHRLIEVNITDEYFKEKEKAQKFESELKIKQDELYDMKHDVINKDMIIKSTKEALKKSEDALSDAQKRIYQLEADLKERKNSK